MFFTTLFAIGIGWFFASLMAGIIGALAFAPVLEEDDLELLDFVKWDGLEDVRQAWFVVWDYREVFYPAFALCLLGLVFTLTAFINSPYA